MRVSGFGMAEYPAAAGTHVRPDGAVTNPEPEERIRPCRLYFR
jgi:hypothetical protein